MDNSKVTSWYRVEQALSHRQPDRVPFDLGSSNTTGINKHAYLRLREYLGLPKKEIVYNCWIQQLAKVDDDVIEALDIDIMGVGPNNPSGYEVNMSIEKINGKDYKVADDEHGITWTMPVEGGHYFDMRRHPLADYNSLEEIKTMYKYYKADDPARFTDIAKKCNDIAKVKQKACVVSRHTAGIFELGLWLRGFENFFMDMALNPGYAEGVLDMVTEMKMAYWDKALEQAGDNILIVAEADDLATQNSLMVSKDMYRKFIQPRHKKLYNFIKEKAKRKVYIFHHSCGAVKDLLWDLIESGVDIINPVQISAKDMNPIELKREFGKDITFWGGIDAQHILPHGTPKEVKEETKRIIDILGKGGGFILNSCHNVQSDVPPENIVAMVEGLRESK